MAESYSALREKYPVFRYKSYEYTLGESTLDISYKFEIDGLTEFNPKWSVERKSVVGIDENTLERMVFSLGMVELVSYWKATCSPEIHLPTELSDDALCWWKKLYLNGLGEFFYRNGIEYSDDVMTFVCADEKIPCDSTAVYDKNSDNVLVPVGGGKDSVVTLEILKGKKNVCAYAINPKKANYDTVEVAGLSEKFIKASRTIDKNLLDLNARGFLNGHTPFSAIVAFSGVIAAYINGIGNVVLSNESSANESTVENTNVNHQYSKSYEFESDFIRYEKEYLLAGVRYFSFLRPLLEIQIARAFSEFKAYYPVFKSCNLGSKTDIWCCNCAKCLFVYIILSPFIPEDELVGIFGENLLDSDKLTDDFEKLLGIQAEKPFECVGERSEVLMAMNMLIDKRPDNLPYLVEKYRDRITENKADYNACLNYFDKENSLPEEFERILADFLEKTYD